MVLDLDLLPLDFHLAHYTVDLPGEGVKNQRSTRWESRVEVEAAVKAL